MKTDVKIMKFSSREEFRDWLEKNSETSEGVWLSFSKTKEVTISASDALEEALCFGWIDGQMKSISDAVYHKYFAKRRAKSIWSDRNKRIVENLRNKGIMTELGEQAIQQAKNNGMWFSKQESNIQEEQIEEFEEKLKDYTTAYDNFKNMSPSVQKTYFRRYSSFKTMEARERDFIRIVERLNNNLKPM